MEIDVKPNSGIALVRAEYTFPYLELLRSEGAPVDRELRRARLPSLIEEMPDAYVSTDLIFRFLEQITQREGIDNIGFKAGWQLTFDDLGPDLRDALRQAPTLQTAIETFSRLISMEDSEYRCSLAGSGKKRRICIQQYIPAGADTRIAEWQNIKAVVELVRQYQQPDWLPDSIGLISPFAPTAAEQAELGNIEVCTGQSNTWVEIPATLLSRTRSSDSDACSRLQKKSASCTCVSNLSRFEDDLTSRLKSALFPYLGSGYPGIELAADIAGISVRNLQRQLDRNHTSYTALLENLRFEHAMHLLQHTDLKILDIALSLGYSDASNFARTVRRISGFSPRELRQSNPFETH